MPLTKNTTESIPEEIWKVYETIMGIAFYDEDILLVKQVFSASAFLIGTAEQEMISGHMELIKFFEDQRKASAGMNFSLQRIRIKAWNTSNTTFCIVDEYDMIIDSKVAFRIRVSSTYSKHGARWLCDHAHSSVPDRNIPEDEFWPIEELKRQNQILEEKVAERTRELEIEAAVERVRAQAMGMQNSNDLKKVALRLSKEVHELSLDSFIGAGIYLIDENDFINIWDFSYFENEKKELEFSQIRFDGSKYPVIGKTLLGFYKGKEKFHVFNSDSDFVQKSIADWKKIDPAIADKVKKFLASNPDANGWNAFAKFDHGFLSFDLLEPPSEDIKQTELKMAAAFQQAYTRFLDLQKAEKQARESQIEAAVERIRAHAMSMHSTEDFNNVMQRIWEEIKELDIEGFAGTSVMLFDEEFSSMYDFSSIGNIEDPNKKVIRYRHKNKKVLKKPWLEWKKKTPQFEMYLKGDKFLRCIEEEWGDVDKEIQAKFVNAIKSGALTQQWNIFSFFPQGYLTFDLLAEPSADAKFINQRMASAMALAFKRYEDLQKAEAQAREAQIEVAIERIRAQSMSMQSSEDFSKVSEKMWDEIQSLEVAGVTGAWIILEDEEGYFNAWDFSSFVHIGNPTHQKARWNPKKFTQLGSYLLESLEKAKDYFVMHYDLKRLKKVRKEWESIVPEMAQGLSEAISSGQLTNVWNPCGKLSNGFMGLDMVEEPNEDTKAIVLKMTRAFEQAYQRYLDLKKAEAQAREAQIEASLERSRTQSMMMQHSDEIMHVSNVFHEQLIHLGIPSEFSYVWLPDEANESHQFWASWSEGKDKEKLTRNKQVTYPLDKSEPYTAACFDAWNNPEIVNEAFVSPSETKEFFKVWKELLSGATNLKARFFPKGLYYSEAYMRYGCFGINIRRTLSDEEKDILKRFSKEFERAYTRFLDLKKAEAQARAAEIEVAIERIRARALAMHESSEIQKVTVEIRKQLVALGLTEVSAATIYLHLDNGSIGIWDVTEVEGNQSDNLFNLIMQVEPKDIPKHLWMWRILNSKEDYWVNEMSLKELKDCAKWLRTIDEETANEFQKFLDSGELKHLWQPTVPLKKGKLNIDFISPPPAEMADILPKMGAAFDLAYKRFEDLQKAEAQAREAQIEAALERIRAASMAMHSSDGMLDVIKIVSEQLSSLGIKYNNVNFGKVNQEESYRFWISMNRWPTPIFFDVPRIKHPMIDRLEDARVKNLSLLEDKLSPAQNAKWIKHISKSKNFEFISKEEWEDIATRPVARSSAITPNIFLVLANYKGRPYTPEQNQILVRFAKVFEQSYTRFLDLQKAEAQAREAQIEATLERVRAASMAMHQSTDLQKVIHTLFDQMSILDIPADSAQISIHYPNTKDFNMWVFSPGESYSKLIRLPYLKSPITDDYWNHLNSGPFSRQYDKKVKNHFFRFAFKNSELRDVSDERKKMVLDAPTLNRSAVAVDQAGISILNYRNISYSTEVNGILGRLLDVFNQAYIRFKDLQKAEAQAREAQIELSLERVRARTMAMKSQSDLLDIIELFGEQLSAIGITYDHVTFIEGTISKKRDWDLWSYVPTSGNKSKKIFIPYTDNSYFRKTAKAVEAYQKTGKSIHVKTFNKEENKEFLDHYWRYAPEESKEIVDHVYSTPGQTIIDAFLEEVTVSLVRWNQDPYTEQELEIFERFAKEFRRTYIRFLDIKKAEQQAREAKIEASLERVRARTMGMQQSSELSIVAAELFNQLIEVGIETERINIGIIREEDNAIDFWVTEQGGKQINKHFSGSLKEPILLSKMYRAWKNGEKSLVQDLTGKKLEKWLNYLQNELGIPFKSSLKQERRVQTSAFFSHGLLVVTNPTPIAHEQIGILERFAKVFEQTYTRFLDLQKAEAQAREAQIEASLERVRARSMGMQNSEEIQDVVFLLYDEVHKLGIDSTSVQIEIFRENSNGFHCWVASEFEAYGSEISFFPTGDGVVEKFVQARKDGASEYFFSLGKKKKDAYYRKALKQADLQMLPKEKKDLIWSSDYLTAYAAWRKYTGLHLVTFDRPEFKEDEKKILNRFADVFDQFYVRFLDLLKAEEQTREAQIELALERIRAQSSAMQQSTDLLDIMVTMRTEFVKLGHEAHYFWHMKWLPDKYEKAMTSGDGTKIGMVMSLPRSIHGDIKKVAKWEKSTEPILVFPMAVDQAVDYVDKMITLGDFEQVDPQAPTLDDVRAIGGLTFIMARTSHGEIGYSLPGYVVNPPEEAQKILIRFASTFDLAYRRFEDLKKAEAQAREAQIEASLEKVRAATMAMHGSADVGSAVIKMFDELTALGLAESVRCGIGILNRHDHFMELWNASKENETVLHFGKLDMRLHPALKNARNGWLKNQPVNFYHLKGQDMVDYYTVINNSPDYSFKFNIKNLPTERYHYDFAFNNGIIYAFTLEELSEEFIKIFCRFSDLFNQTYQRYLDLTRAEAQAREAQIETALERVRSQAMAMHQSSEITNVLTTMFEELEKLDLELTRCIIWIFDNENKVVQWWLANPEEEGGVKSYRMNYSNHSVFKEHIKAWKKRESVWLYKISGGLKKSWDDEIFKGSELSTLPKEVIKAMRKPDTLYFSGTCADFGILRTVSLQPIADENVQIIRRFGQIFQQSYTRFKDVLRAEAQAREAQIEAALERVRAEAMAMHQPSDLVKVNKTMITEITNLGIKHLTGAAIILFDENDILTMWDISDPGNMGNTRDNKSIYDPRDFDVLGDFWRRWKKGEDYFVIAYDFKTVTTALEEWKRVDYENYLNLKKAIDEDKLKTQWNPFASFSKGLLTLDMMEPPEEDTKKIIVKMARTFDLAYQRFDDLLKAEEQANEARKQASLDRIRAEIASMRSQKDLEQFTPMIWSELSALDISFFRCGIFIMDAHRKSIQMYLSTPRGQSIAVMSMDFNNSEITKSAATHWENQTIHREEWSKEQFVEWSENLAQQGLIKSPKSYQYSTFPPEKLCLQFVPFKQGMLYIGTETFLDEDDLELVQDVADAFSIAYTRYEDFVQLEKAKHLAENALGELRSTQSQLVHAEKMASLGELTAGIAHEIQNPLNFVNNFSDLNKELLEELREALEKNDLEEAFALLDDLNSNEQKIVHHGKRAEDIVKGMLLHSRTGDGKKEPTDINALADEFLRLSYHGLRAKDKSFNADFKCTLDKDLPKVKVVSQDIGRVLLNLINNAFHATAEKAQTTPNYKPKVEVITEKNANGVKIMVQDNGAGIPEKIREKIFQPFFTTKATGSGTGLGLSLSHEIITKGHNGTIAVESEVGKGTTFILNIPIA